MMTRLAAYAVLVAMALGTTPGSKLGPDWGGDRKEPINTGRRAEKNSAAIAKAEAKRARKAAKRAANNNPGVQK